MNIVVMFKLILTDELNYFWRWLDCVLLYLDIILLTKTFLLWLTTNFGQLSQTKCSWISMYINTCACSLYQEIMNCFVRLVSMYFIHRKCMNVYKQKLSSPL